MEKQRMYARVSGRVQGVGFRHFVRIEAQKLGLTGWVRNMPDGDVELEAEGPSPALEELRQRLWKGPALSRVDDVKDDLAPAQGGYQEFVVR